jgi:very-short-patch-repair endonuclease
MLTEGESAASGHSTDRDTPPIALSLLRGLAADFEASNITRMPRAPLVPSQLTRAPFTLPQARLRGLTEDHLRGATWRRVHRGVFVWHGIAEQSLVRLRAAVHRLPAGGVFSGNTAGWLHGLDVDPCDPIEITVPAACKVTRLAGFSLRRSTSIERAIAHGMPATSRVRTVVDLARRLPLIDAVIVLDMALHRRLASLSSLKAWAAANSGRRGVAALRRALDLAEPATESPMETRLRLLLIFAGLPKPRVQTKLRDRSGAFLARPDLYYPTHCLAIEYDGVTHKDSIAADNRRQNRLLDTGHRVLRFTAGDVLGNPSAVVSLVRRTIARPVEGF